MGNDTLAICEVCGESFETLNGVSFCTSEGRNVCCNALEDMVLYESVVY